MAYLIELMKESPDKDIYELMKTDIDDKFEKHTLTLTTYKPEKRKKRFEKLKSKLKENTL
jgi:hypothetical protein